MPATSEKQRKFMAMIYNAKKSGKVKELSGEAKAASKGLSEEQAHDFMKTEPKEKDMQKKASEDMQKLAGLAALSLSRKAG